MARTISYRGGIELGVIIIDGDPVPKQRPRFGRGRMFTPKPTIEYEQRVAEEYKAQKGEIFDLDPVKLVIRAYYRIPKSASLRQQRACRTGMMVPTKRPDLDNIIKIIMDGLNGVAYADDKQVVYVTAGKEYSDTPRVEIEVLPHFGKGGIER